MANPLTGDFEAVLQVSGATVNRLVASIHQNHGLTTELPRFPHSIGLRIGDPTPIEGMRGTAWGQVSVPRVELIHGSEDRFRLEVGIRVRYVADPGTTALPELIHGTVRAEYQIQSIDPDCWGWRAKAPDYLWIRVIGSTVSFTGTAVNDIKFTQIEIIDEAAIDARITRLIRRLLQTEFAATPHKVSRRFRRGAMRSLNLGVHRSLVALPMSLTGAQPQGRVDSITQDLLDGADFAIAIAGQAIVSRFQPELDQFKADFAMTLTFKHRTYLDLGPFGDVDVITITITWGIKITNATAQWFGGPIPFFNTSTGGFIVTIAGQARTEKSAFNIDFDAALVLELLFDGVNERFVLALKGTPVVNLHGTFAGIAEPYAKPRIINEIVSRVNGLLGGLGDQLTLKPQKEELVTQLGTIDSQPNAGFEQVVYSSAGVVVRGRIYLSARRPPVQKFVMTPEQNGFNALESWIPGGRIDALEWSWTWFNGAGSKGSATHDDRFLLRRPPGKKSKFGIFVALTEPLPGLDGMGTVCLNVRGVQVHPVTGEFVPVSTGRRCTRFGFDIRLVTPGRLFLREWEPGPRDPIGPVAERALIEVGGRNSPGPAVNTLVIFVGEEWTEEHQAVLRDGLAASKRRDAGLLVLVLFRDGVLMARGAQLMPELTRLAAELEAPLVVNEDVHGSWSTAMSVDLGQNRLEYRLVTSTGGTSWAHSGATSARDLAGALDDYLFPSVAPGAQPLRGGVNPGDRLVAFDSGLLSDLFEYLDTCPPPPVGIRGLESTVVFAQKGSLGSEAMTKAIAAHQAGQERDRLLTLIVDGADLREIAELKTHLPEDVLLIPDSQGDIANRFGVRGWPTTVTVSEEGIVTGVSVGLEAEDVPRKSEERP